MDWKTWKKGNIFQLGKKPGIFEQNGNVREFYPKYWTSEAFLPKHWKSEEFEPDFIFSLIFK